MPRLPDHLRDLWPTGLALLGLLGWLYAPALANGELLGAPGTDALRALWGFDHVARSLPAPPWWTDRVGFPAGAKLLVLPAASSLLGWPLHAVLGPLQGYGAWAVGMLWLGGMASAWLVRRVSGSGAAALLAGVAAVLQPITLLAVTDGTAEQLAFWALPATIAAAWGMRPQEDAPERAAWERGGSTRAAERRAGILAGAFATVMVLDSPYNVVFAVPFLLIALWGAPRAALVSFAATSLVGAGLAWLAYRGLPVAVDDDKRALNAIQLAAWRQWENGGDGRPWSFSLGATFVPVSTVIGALALAALRPTRAWPWVVVAALCFAFGIGPAADNGAVLGEVLGAPGRAFGEAATAFNTSIEVPIVRFPRRWLLPMGLALSVAAGVGIARLRAPSLRGALVGGRLALPLGPLAPIGSAVASIALAVVTLRMTRFREGLPHHAPPAPAFAAFVRDSPLDGAVLAVPRVRSARVAAARREDILVFASLGPALASADLLYLQVLTGRPAVFAPEGLRTLSAAPQSPGIAKLLTELDDYTLPQTVGREIPAGALASPSQRADAAEALVDAGVRFALLDDAALGDNGLRLVREAFHRVLREERYFADGTGVTVLLLGRDGEGP